MNKITSIFVWIKNYTKRKKEKERQIELVQILLQRIKQAIYNQFDINYGTAMYQESCAIKLNTSAIFGTSFDPYENTANCYRFIYKVIGKHAAKYFLNTNDGARLSMQYSAFTDINNL